MDRSAALAPLTPGEGRLPAQIGALLRGQVRKAAILRGIDFYEEKGWFESTFVFRGPAHKIVLFKNAMDVWAAED